MLQYRGANVQILDVPGLIEGAAGGRGGGKEVLSVVRTADLVVFILSVFEIWQYERLDEELYANKIRLDQEPPTVRITRKGKGGIDINSPGDLSLDDDTIREVLRERGVVNADVTIRGDPDIDRLVDGVMDNRVYIPSLVLVNKVDLVDDDYLDTVRDDLRSVGIDPDRVVYVSAEADVGLDRLEARLWDALDLIRVYMDKPGRGVDYEEPLIVRQGDAVGDTLEKLGGSFDERFRFARVTGPSAKHDEQQVGRDHVLADEDVLRIVARK